MTIRWAQAVRTEKNRRSIRDVALLAGVSPGCASNVLNHRRRQDDPIGRAVLAAAATLGCRANSIAANLRRVNSRFVGVVLPDIETASETHAAGNPARCWSTSLTAHRQNLLGTDCVRSILWLCPISTARAAPGRPNNAQCRLLSLLPDCQPPDRAQPPAPDRMWPSARLHPG